MIVVSNLFRSVMQSMVRFLTVRDPGAAGSGHAARHAEFFPQSEDPSSLDPLQSRAVKFRRETLEASGRESQSRRSFKHHGRRLLSLICTVSHEQFVDELITFMTVRYLVA